MFRKSRLLAIGLSAAAAVLLGMSGGGAGPSPARAAPARITLGAVLDLSGKGASRGREARDALLLEVDRINQGSGELGGREIFLVTFDSRGRPEGAAEAVRKLARDYKAVAIIGPILRPTTLAAAEEAERSGIPLITLSSFEALFDAKRRWIFSTAQSVSMAVRRILLHMRERGVSRMAVLAAYSA
ncbi:MAG: ABC transporter substrate-binding protein, partial [bacterium]